MTNQKNLNYREMKVSALKTDPHIQDITVIFYESGKASMAYITSVSYMYI